MTDTGLKWLSFFLGTGFLIFLCRIIFFSGKYCKSIDYLDKSIDSLNKENSEINKKIDTLINCFNRLTAKLENVKGIAGLNDVYFKSASPLSLTPVGKTMLQESGLKDFIDANKDELIKNVESQKPQTNYDAEAISRSVMLSLSDDPRLNTVKDYAFQNGKDLTMMLMAGGIYLRDMVFSKNITITEKEPKNEA